MKVKYSPADFVVREELRPHHAGDHYLYLVEKEGITTWEVQRQLAKCFRIAPRSLSFCGLKDRNAVAAQFMSSKRELAGQYRTRKFALTLVGRIDHALGAGDIDANHFEITLRDLPSEQADRMVDATRKVADFGLANYFDEQRFESRLGADDFVARRLMLGQYEGALRLLIAQPLKLDSTELKQFKRLVAECWGEWMKLSRLGPRKYQAMFRRLADDPGSVQRAFSFFDHDYLEFLVSAFQSFLWNEAARCFLQEVAPDGFDYQYFLGRFYFFQTIGRRFLQYPLPVVNYQTKLKDDTLARVYQQVLAQQGLEQPMLRLKYPERIKVKTFDRALAVRPAFKDARVTDDRHFPGRVAVILKFSLPAGSYATLLVKRLVGPKKTTG